MPIGMTKQEVVAAVEAGKQISDGTFWLWKKNDSMYHVECGCDDPEGCFSEDYATFDEAWEPMTRYLVHVCKPLI